MTQSPDTKPGYYYVSAIDGARSALVRGPFRDDHAGALASVDSARERMIAIDPRAHWYAFGTCRSDADLGPGYLDATEGGGS